MVTGIELVQNWTIVAIRASWASGGSPDGAVESGPSERLGDRADDRGGEGVGVVGADLARGDPFAQRRGRRRRGSRDAA